MTKQILQPHVDDTAQAAIDNVAESAKALARTLNEAADAGVRMEVEIVPLACTSHRKVLVHVARVDEGRRPEDLNSANDG